MTSTMRWTAFAAAGAALAWCAVARLTAQGPPVAPFPDPLIRINLIYKLTPQGEKTLTYFFGPEFSKPLDDLLNALVGAVFGEPGAAAVGPVQAKT